jgi:hypothetical protein
MIKVFKFFKFLDNYFSNNFGSVFSNFELFLFGFINSLKRIVYSLLDYFIYDFNFNFEFGHDDFNDGFSFDIEKSIFSSSLFDF